MIRAMYSGISGMRAFQTKLDVISNNVANVNTSGFKLARTTFRDIMSQTIAAGTVPQATQGGINARQIGLGVGLSSVDTIFTQGSAQSTGVKTDLMIEGDGFFVVSENASGSALGPLNTVNIKSTNLTYNTSTPPQLEQIEGEISPISFNIPKNKEIKEYKLFINGQAYSGNPLTIDPDGKATFNLQAPDIDPAVSEFSITVIPTVTDTILNQDEDLAASSPLVIRNNQSLDQKNKSSVDSIGLLFTRAGNFYFDKNRNLVTADGLFVMDTQGAKIQISPLAVAYNIDDRGYIVQVDNKGDEIENPPRIGIAKFANPQGLEKVGAARFRYTRVADESAQPRDYIFESDNFEKGTGKIRSGFLEMSNVDLGVEFSEMIQSQRGFQANTRIITTSDEMLQEVVNLKR